MTDYKTAYLHLRELLEYRIREEMANEALQRSARRRIPNYRESLQQHVSTMVLNQGDDPGRPVAESDLKEKLLKLLQSTNPSDVILANCITLISREQVGIQKYGVTLSDANLNRAQLTQHALEEALDLANYLQAETQRKDA